MDSSMDSNIKKSDQFYMTDASLDIDVLTAQKTFVSVNLKSVASPILWTLK